MKLALLALVLLAGCGTVSGQIDRQLVLANQDNVHAVTAQNERFLKADPRAESLKQSDRDRNAGANDVADKLAGAK